MWNVCLDMEDVLPCFKGICQAILTTPIKVNVGRLEVQVNPEDWDGYEERDNEDKETEEVSEENKKNEDNEVNEEGQQEAADNLVQKQNWNDRLTMFQKLCVVKSFKEEKVI